MSEELSTTVFLVINPLFGSIDNMYVDVHTFNPSKFSGEEDAVADRAKARASNLLS